MLSTSSSALNGYNGFTINGVQAGDATGYAVASAGDFNGDGRDDLLIGAPGSAQQKGRAFILFGIRPPFRFQSVIELASLTSTQGVAFEGGVDTEHVGYSGCAVDLNGDTALDIVIGSNLNDASARANVVVFFATAPVCDDDNNGATAAFEAMFGGSFMDCNTAAMMGACVGEPSAAVRGILHQYCRLTCGYCM